MTDFYIGQGDTASPLSDVLRDAAGAPVDIQGASIHLTLTPIRGGAPLVDGPAENDQNADGADGSKGRVHFEWGAGDTDDAGTFLGTWTVTYAGGEIQTFPNAGYIAVRITPDAPSDAPSNYVTLEELKQTLNLQGRTFADLDLEVALAAAATALDEHYGGPWTLGAPGEARYFTPVHKDSTIDLRQLQDVTAVDLDTAGGGTYDTALVRGTDFELELNGAANAVGPWNTLRMLRSGLAWEWEYPRWRHPYPWGVDSLRITGTWGWVETPPGVKAATTIVATRVLRRAREGPFGIVGLGIEGTSIRASSIARDPEIAFVMRGGAGKGPGAMRTLIV